MVFLSRPVMSYVLREFGYSSWVFEFHTFMIQSIGFIFPFSVFCGVLWSFSVLKKRTRRVNPWVVPCRSVFLKKTHKEYPIIKREAKCPSFYFVSGLMLNVNLNSGFIGFPALSFRNNRTLCCPFIIL